VKLAASNIAWLPDQDARVAALLKRAGFEGIEVALTREWPDLASAPIADVRAFARRWSDDGLPIVAAQALLFGRPELLLLGPPAVRRQTIDYLRRVFDLCAAADAVTMVFGSPRNRRREERSQAEAMAIATEVFRELGAEAARRGLVLAIEANPTAYGGDFITTVREAVELVEAVAHPGFRLHLDYGCMTIAGEPIDEAAALARPFVVHAHASAPHLAPVSGSTAPLAPFVTALEAAGYHGWLSLEMRRSDADDLSALERSIEYVRDSAVG
jgi:sugar phosphate isomerase/epimerase